MQAARILGLGAHHRQEAEEAGEVSLLVEVGRAMAVAGRFDRTPLPQRWQESRPPSLPPGDDAGSSSPTAVVFAQPPDDGGVPDRGAHLAALYRRRSE